MRNAFLAVVLFFAVPSFAQDATFRLQSLPPHAPFVHGTLVDVPFIWDADGFLYTSRDYAFLAIHLEPVPEVPSHVDYQQDVDFLASPEGYILREGGIIGRGINSASADEDGWLVLRLNKPCHAGDVYVTVGLVTVCPPRDPEDHRLWGCTVLANGIVPIFDAVPAQQVRCFPEKSRAVRK